MGCEQILDRITTVITFVFSFYMLIIYYYDIVPGIGGHVSSDKLIWYYVLVLIYQTNTRERYITHRT